MIVFAADFVKSATEPAGYPLAGPPEIAFCGRPRSGWPGRQRIVRTHEMCHPPGFATLPRPAIPTTDQEEPTASQVIVTSWLTADVSEVALTVKVEPLPFMTLRLVAVEV